MRRILGLLLIAGLALLPAVAQKDEIKRVESSTEVLEEILNIPDNIPKELLDKAECIVIMPSVKKAAFGIGGKYGKGVMLCRGGQNFTGPWGAPAMFRLEGASIGFQIGGSATDFVLLVMNRKGADGLLKSKVKLGADMSAAAGPKGRTAEAATDATMRAEILSYSRSRGLFAGVSLAGSTLRQDSGANEKLYGRKIEAREIIREGKAGTPAAAAKLRALLQRVSPKNLTE